MNKPPSNDDEAPSEATKAPPTSRLGRLFRLGALAPKALPFALEGAKRAMGRKPTPEEDLASRQKMVVEAKKVAEAMLKTLGEMKGLPLKLGQMASYIDGIAPPGYEEKFQKALKKLQQKAPPLDPEAAERVVRAEFGVPPEQLFAEWEREPFAAASIGQVHRALTRGGDRVAVKVQYPGIDKAIENDLKSLTLLEQFASPLGRRYHTKEGLDEIRAVFLAELDYGREAEMTDLFRRMNADLPGVVIPRVYHSLSSRRVLTTEYLDGQTYHPFCAEASQEERNAAGITVWSFMFRSLYRYGMLYADPHPGNYRFLGQGRVGFLDFGCIKPLPPHLVAGMKRYVTAAMDADWPAFDRACVEVLGYNPEDRAEWELYRSYTLELLKPLTLHEYRCSREAAREAVAYLVRGLRDLAWHEGDDSSLPNMPRPIHMPPDFTFVNRLQWGLASVMGGLGSEARFRELTEPWVRGETWPLPV
jgi:predicted unusual protein kinase regulating ubiquinone biosynthesis (AarF/ABC1/UbiB family)